MPSIILTFLNLGIFLFLAVTFKEKNIYILGGTFLFITIIGFLSLFSSLFRQQRNLLQALMTIVICISGWQYLTYHETNHLLDHETINKLFLSVNIIIYLLLLYIFVSPINPRRDPLDNSTWRNKRIVYKPIFIRIFHYFFVACFFAWLPGIAIEGFAGSYLIRNNILSVVSVGIFVLVLTNIATYLLIRKIPDDFFGYLYQKKNINLSKVIKFSIYLLTVLFIVGGVFEVLTRGRLMLFIETYLFIFSSLLLIWRVYKIENRTIDVNTENIIDRARNDSTNDYSFYIRSILITTAIGSACFILFMVFLKWYKP